MPDNDSSSIFHPCPEQRRRAPSSSRRGGKRPGAGAPKGNLNALKHGRRSKQLNDMAAVLARSPEMRAMLLRITSRHAQREQRANGTAVRLLSRMYTRARDIGRRSKASPRRGPGVLGPDSPEQSSLNDVLKALNANQSPASAPGLEAELHEINAEIQHLLQISDLQSDVPANNPSPDRVNP